MPAPAAPPSGPARRRLRRGHGRRPGQAPAPPGRPRSRRWRQAAARAQGGAGQSQPRRTAARAQGLARPGRAPHRRHRPRRRRPRGPPGPRAQGPAGRALPHVRPRRPEGHPDRRARGPQPHRALRLPPVRRRRADPRQHLPRPGAERAARAWRRPSSTSAPRRTRCSTGATCTSTPTTWRAPKGKTQQPPHRADAQGQADDHLPGHQEPDRRQGRPPHPGGVAARAGSWC